MATYKSVVCLRWQTKRQEKRIQQSKLRSVIPVWVLLFESVLLLSSLLIFLFLSFSVFCSFSHILYPTWQNIGRGFICDIAVRLPQVTTSCVSLMSRIMSLKTWSHYNKKKGDKRMRKKIYKIHHAIHAESCFPSVTFKETGETESKLLVSFQATLYSSFSTFRDSLLFFPLVSPV